MRIVTDRQFSVEKRRLRRDYEEKSGWAAERFKREINAALEAIEAAPTAAGHFFFYGSRTSVSYRRRNLKKFPFFIAYTYENKVLRFLAILPSRSNPQNWFRDFVES